MNWIIVSRANNKDFDLGGASSLGLVATLEHGDVVILADSIDLAYNDDTTITDMLGFVQHQTPPLGSASFVPWLASPAQKIVKSSIHVHMSRFD